MRSRPEQRPDSLGLEAVRGGAWEGLIQLRTSPADARSPSSPTVQSCITRQGCFEVLHPGGFFFFFAPLKQTSVEISISAWGA